MNISALIGTIFFGFMTLFTLMLLYNYKKTKKAFPSDYGYSHYIVALCFFFIVFIAAVTSI